MAEPARNERPGTRQRLIAAAAALFAGRGFRGATLREIADRAGVNLAAANYHFGSKEALYLEVARQKFEGMEHRMEVRGVARGVADVEELPRAELVRSLRERLQAFLDSVLADDDGYGAIMQRELCDPSDALPVIVKRYIDPQRHAMERLIARLAPALSPDEVERCSRSVMGQAAFYLTHRAALLIMMGRRTYPRGFTRAIADHVTEFSIGGIERLAARRRRKRNAR